MEEALILLLLANAALTSKVGADQITWVRAAQNSPRPYVVLQTISSVPDVTHSGPSGLVPARIQVDCYGDTYAATKTVARAVTGALNGFRGTKGSIAFDGIFKDAERDGFEDEASPSKLYRVSMDFIVWHKGA